MCLRQAQPSDMALNNNATNLLTLKENGAGEARWPCTSYQELGSGLRGS
jgi:hypothetical protein